jgi:hydrogenase expression/formation protein HypE
MHESPAHGVACPLPLTDYPHVLLAHGGGGRLMHELIERLFRSAFQDCGLQGEHDAASFPVYGGKMAFTTDSFVVSPIIFPGGDIGSLSVHGTINDLASCGARPDCLSVAFILEEGLPMETLWRVVQSMKGAADAARVRIVTGDTKVVERGKGDQIFITTSGIGRIEHDLVLAPSSVREGDAILVTGDIGRHGMAVMAVREGLEFENEIASDAASLWHLVEALIDAGVAVRCLRDLTRGGLASALNEIALASRLGMRIDERSIPVDEDVRGACEVLGLDPLYVACEGRMAVFVPEAQTDLALDVLREQPHAEQAQHIGTVTASYAGRVRMRSLIGVERVVDMISGEQLPRIC